jgi:2-oxoacid:acceptor oxidoreductase delta subunit (pyruvate/2-ketoisovalerate family)
MADARPISDIEHGVPPVSVSSTSTRVNPTGSWKYMRPVHRDLVAPCNQGCPVGIDVEGYMNLVREGRLEAARELLLRENPLPATTGRVCYHPCESACNRTTFDSAVAVHAVERMLGDTALNLPVSPAPRTRPETVAVVGAGPAGLACAYHLARLGFGVTVYEADSEPGGVLRWGIPEYRLPKAVLAREIDRIRGLGVEFHCEVRVGEDLPFEALEQHDAVFVATGVHRSRELGIPGESLGGVWRGLEFLRAVNGGARPFLGRRVVVVGGGNTALDCARTAVRLGSEVTVLYRRGRAEMPVNEEEYQAALHEGVRFGFLAAPIEVLADAHVPDAEPLQAVGGSFGESAALERAARVRAVRCRKMRLGKADASGRRRPVAIARSEFEVPCDALITALGEDADLDYLPEQLRKGDGAIHVTPLGGSARTAVFAGGDLIEEPHTVAFAIGSGKRAAIGIDHYLRFLQGETAGDVEVGEMRLGPGGNLSMTRWLEHDPVLRVNPVNEVVRPDQINQSHFAHAPRWHDFQRPAWEARHDFEETNLGLSHEDALAEARRCFNCGVCTGCEVCLVFCPDVAIRRRDDGRFEFDYDHCKGCGLCATECPRGCVTMTREGS